MRDDLITVVTGEPRSGTSLQMQSLHLLGVPVAGKEFPIVGGKIDRKPEPNVFQLAAEQHHERMNPQGFYEIPGVVMRGTRNIDSWKGKAVKIITAGLWPRTSPDGRELGTPTELVDKYVFCVRHPRQIAESQQDLADRSLLGPSDDGSEWSLPRRGVSARPFIMRSGPALIWLSNQSQDVLDKFMSVDFGDMISDAAAVIPTVAEHIEYSYTPAQLRAAVGNVNDALNRSVSLKEWPEGMAVEGAVAEKMYFAFKSLDLTELAAAATAVQELVLDRQHEGASWVDDEDTWVTMSVPTKRAIMANTHNLGTTLRAQLPEYRNGFMICDQCDHYARDAEKLYTVERPADLGPLTRSMVKCARDDEFKTVEMCKSCWQQGSTVNGDLMPPQRTTQTGLAL